MPRASTSCAELGPTNEKAAAELGDAITKKCSGIDVATLSAPSGPGIAGLAPHCAIVGVAGLATLDQYVECLERVAACTTDGATALAEPFRSTTASRLERRWR